MLKRREALASISAIAGHALFPGVLDGFARAQARPASPPAAWQPELLSPALGEVLADVVETILPETDTPGAKAAKVHVFVDLAAKACLSPAEQRTLVAGLEELDGGFVELGQADREARLQRIDAAAFKLLKDLTLLGYFTSEIGCTRALAYEAVPGGYRGCISLQPRQKAWATRHPGYTRGFAYEVYTGRFGWEQRAGEPGVGATLKESLTRPDPWWVWMEGYGECLPRRENRVSLNYDRLDKWACRRSTSTWRLAPTS